MKILSASQTRALDAYTIEHEPITSIDLMERASLTFVNWFVKQFPSTEKTVYIFCGIGNNGGDGLAVARLLQQRFYTVEIYCCAISEKLAPDFETNLSRLPKRADIPIYNIQAEDDFPRLQEQGIIIDAIFGSGLNRAVEGYWAKLILWLNQQSLTKVAIDIPSGLFADQHTAGTSIQADYTFSFELPKLAFFFPENQNRLGSWHFQSIGLNQDFIQQTESTYFYVNHNLAKSLLRKRQKFDHKGTFGHALLIMGSYGKVGASILAAKACLRTGAGLVSVHAPKCAYEILQISIPEAMVSLDEEQFVFSKSPNLEAYSTLGIGCGLGQDNKSASALKQTLSNWKKPMLLDADALNLLSQNKDWYTLLPENSILTPHPKEFERLFGSSSNHFERFALQQKMAQTLKCIIILKGANTCIALPDGTCYFNTTGNPGMATAGSGDVLSGIIVALLAQAYLPFEAAILGVYLHGLAGDLAAEELGQASLIAGDLVKYLSTAFIRLQSSKI